MGHLVVGVDGSDGADEALRWAVDEARLHGWTVTALATVGPSGTVFLDAIGRGLHEHVIDAVGEQAGLEVQEREWQGSVTSALIDAARRGSELEVMHAWRLQYAGAYPYPAGVDPAVCQEAATAVAEEMIGRVDVEGAGVKLITTVSANGAIAAILHASELADLVVVGSRGLGGFKGVLLGSVAHAVAQHVTCPVIVIPPSRD